MRFEEVMVKIRSWDNRLSRWMLNHFYIMFFQFVLVIIFFFFFYHIFKVLDLEPTIPQKNQTDQLLYQQSVLTLIIIMLLILNSFWMLFIFDGVNRLRLVLKEISYNIMRRRQEK